MATGLLAALTAHAALEPTSITIYNIDDVPTTAEAIRTLPCVVPLLGEIAGNPAFDVISVSGGHADLSFNIGFALLVHQMKEERPQQLPEDVITAFDNYFDAIRADPDLSGALSDDLIMDAEFGIIDWKGESWAGVMITQTWVFLVDA